MDQQLPLILAAWLRGKGHDAAHTRELDQKTTRDNDILASACEGDAVVVSKDGDFVQLITREVGARLVWVRIGNCDNPTLIARFEQSWLMLALESGARLVELR